ncbi:conserved hypothetical protein [Ricinus communis]|uniref:Uncharacterized protein n=1 Tax=Ricinus communis TaxID=3988 RepID=B9TCE1_RICCO|nr:conserved hypothetical protein [Ricinus communis]
MDAFSCYETALPGLRTGRTCHPVIYQGCLARLPEFHHCWFAPTWPVHVAHVERYVYRVEPASRQFEHFFNDFRESTLYTKHPRCRIRDKRLHKACVFREKLYCTATTVQ